MLIHHRRTGHIVSNMTRVKSDTMNTHDGDKCNYILAVLTQSHKNLFKSQVKTGLYDTEN